MLMSTLIIFYNIRTLAHYCWNGAYPVGIDGGVRDSPVWHPRAELSEKETAFFKALETSKKRGFELKDKGKFAILQRIKTIQDET
jgi:hypothetical protein